MGGTHSVKSYNYFQGARDIRSIDVCDQKAKGQFAGDNKSIRYVTIPFVFVKKGRVLTIIQTSKRTLHRSQPGDK